jgi:hypothetical protein
VTNCGDHHGVSVKITPVWKRYDLTWAELTQAGWGAVAPFEPMLQGLEWQLLPGAFDVSVDHVGFLVGPPSAPVADLLDGFEDCDLGLPANGGRAGGWYAYSSAGVTLTPSPLATTAGGAPAGAACALRVQGTVTGGGSAYAGFGVTPRTPPPYDASVYGGLALWAKGTGTVRLELVTDATLPTDGGGTCASGCWDHYGFRIPLAPQWTRYVLPWHHFTQSGWGTAVALDPTKLRNLQVALGGGATYDVWIDEVAFLAAP